MREMGIKALQRRKRKNYNQATAVIKPNILNQDFNAGGKNMKWATDITYLNYNNRRLYLSIILDLYNREVVSYEISDRNDNQLVISTLNKALEKSKDVRGIILHSDQGSQYTTEYYSRYLTSRNMIQSMSRKGNCLDNAQVECFFSHLKSELIYTTTFHSEEDMVTAVESYIKFYNYERIQQKLKNLPPVAYFLQGQNDNISHNVIVHQ